MNEKFSLITNLIYLAFNNNNYIFYIEENSNILDGEFEIEEKLIKNNESENNQRIICLNNYEIHDKICYLSCLHLFHSSCIKEWLKRSNKCPFM